MSETYRLLESDKHCAKQNGNKGVRATGMPSLETVQIQTFLTRWVLAGLNAKVAFLQSLKKVKEVTHADSLEPCVPRMCLPSLLLVLHCFF